MKYFILVILFSFDAFAQLKLLYEEQTLGKNPPTLYLVNDFRKPQSKRFLDTGVAKYDNNAYMIATLKEGKLYVIADFENLTKQFVADEVMSFEIKGSSLFFVRLEGAIKVLYYVPDVKNPSKQDVVSNIASYKLDSEKH